ncbi:uncharacterized protein METZ01_LOCUS209922 [marine metagenome]|uniref:Uncharacterized protein n=1 Tax=marine metagenome TaxID=408172 RepID=A0A382F232_9ZZZZ
MTSQFSLEIGARWSVLRFLTLSLAPLCPE